MTQPTRGTPIDPIAILNLRMGPNNRARASTVREYLVEYLRRAWQKQTDVFDDHPYQDSHGREDLHTALMNAGLITEDALGDGDWEKYEEDISTFIEAAIAGLAVAPTVSAPLPAPTPTELAAATHANHDYTTDGWRYWCETCNPLDQDEHAQDAAATDIDAA